MKLQADEHDQTIIDQDKIISELGVCVISLEEDIVDCRANNEKLVAFANKNGLVSVIWQEYSAHQDDLICYMMDECLMLYSQDQQMDIKALLLETVGNLFLKLPRYMVVDSYGEAT